MSGNAPPRPSAPASRKVSRASAITQVGEGCRGLGDPPPPPAPSWPSCRLSQDPGEASPTSHPPRSPSQSTGAPAPARRALGPFRRLDLVAAGSPPSPTGVSRAPGGRLSFPPVEPGHHPGNPLSPPLPSALGDSSTLPSEAPPPTSYVIPRSLLPLVTTPTHFLPRSFLVTPLTHPVSPSNFPLTLTSPPRSLYHQQHLPTARAPTTVKGRGSRPPPLEIIV